MKESTKIAIAYGGLWLVALLLSLFAFSENVLYLGIILFIISIGCIAGAVWIRSNPYWLDPDPEWEDL